MEFKDVLLAMTGPVSLKDVLKLLDNVPLSDFDDYATYNGIMAKIGNMRSAWCRSGAYQLKLEKELAAAEERRKRDGQKAVARDRQVRKWIKEGALVKGTFIKVLGARDGKGIREVIDIERDRINCRQWRPVHIGRKEVVDPDEMRSHGYLKIDGIWVGPEAQMTSHDFNKVSKLLS